MNTLQLCLRKVVAGKDMLSSIDLLVSCTQLVCTEKTYSHKKAQIPHMKVEIPQDEWSKYRWQCYSRKWQPSESSIAKSREAEKQPFAMVCLHHVQIPIWYNPLSQADCVQELFRWLFRLSMGSFTSDDDSCRPVRHGDSCLSNNIAHEQTMHGRGIGTHSIHVFCSIWYIHTAEDGVSSATWCPPMT